MDLNNTTSQEIIIYQTDDGAVKIDVKMANDTVWLSLDLMAELFQRDKSTISLHIKNIFSEGELSPDSVVANVATTAADGKQYQVDFYNLDVIISVGYRVKSQRGTQFRIWATKRLKEYIRKGFTLDDNRVSRADAEKEFMGLTTFEGDRPHLKDAVIAKNYLDEKELRAMGQIVSGYLDFAERQAHRTPAMTMKEWAEHLDNILTMSGEKLLQGAGKVSHQEAIEHATNEYKKYQQRTLSQVEKDFLDNIKSLPKN